METADESFGPEQMCRSYAAGTMGRAELIDRLGSWKYTPGDRTDGYDSLIVDPPGSWFEVETAHHRGLIDDSIYEEALNLSIARSAEIEG